MDKLKGVVGLGGKQEEGQEPVSGAQGEGSATTPYDAGNSEGATDQAEGANDASKSEPAPAQQSSSTQEDEPQYKEEEEKKKGGGGGFLKSIGLGGGGKKKEEEKDAQAGAEKPEVDETEAQKHLPPNHLPSAVPEGTSSDLADSGKVAPGQADGLATQKSATSEPVKEETTPNSPSDAAAAAAGKQPDRGASVGSGSGLSPERARSTGSGAATQLPGSRGEHRGSMIPQDAPKYKRVENPDRIPTAGGKRIGEEQYQTRRASVAPSASPTRDSMPTLDREGSPDPVTAGNTEANAQPMAPVAEGKNTAPQQMKEYSMGDASKEAEAPKEAEADAVPAEEAGPKDEVAPDDKKAVDSAAAADAAKADPSPATTSAPASGKENASGGHTRRASVFDKLKDKIKGHKSSGKSS